MAQIMKKTNVAETAPVTNEAQVVKIETVATEQKQQPTASEKLEQLKATLLAKQTDVASGKFAAGSPEFLDAMLEMFKLGNEIKTEEANIARILKEVEIGKKRNERLAIVDALLEAYAAHIRIEDQPDATIEQKNIAYGAYKEARTPIDNEMLIRVPSGIASKKAVDGLAPKTQTEGGEKGKAIIAYFLEQRLSNVPDTQIKKDLVANGHAVGTVGSVILAWQRLNGEK